MADFSEQGPFEGLYPRTSSQRRRLSYASQNSGMSAAGRAQLHLRGQPSAASIRSYAESETDMSEIHSPVPRRHLLLRSESEHWLQTPSFSPGSSRPTSPVPPSNPRPAAISPPRGAFEGRTLSFGSLLDSELAQHAQRKPSGDDSKPVVEVNEGTAKRWAKWMHRNRLRDEVALLSILAAFWIKFCVGLSSYSGAGTPPLFGDYEAQRHWMELTVHLPIRDWYSYDHEYWGLDYPPLTAYHSWLCGFIGSMIEPAWFALDKSRGIESVESKLFMRSTALLSDFLVYLPALLFFIRSWLENRSRRTQGAALLLLLFQPSLLLIDFGHFQFNSVMLGFTLLAIDFFSVGKDELGAICFVASLGFKQMALYYAPAIGSYLLGKCLYRGWIAGSKLFLRLGLVTIVSFFILFMPFLPPFAPMSSIMVPIARIFPFGRGLFEDKVANFWCATNVIFKWRVWFSQPLLVKLSAVLTAFGFLPAVVNLIVGGFRAGKLSPAQTNVDTATPTLPILPWALLTSSMSFFLFSFQVHEKTILLPLLPLNLLLSGATRGSFMFEWGVLTNNVAVFSMWPLLKREGLAVPYIALLVLWNRAIGSSIVPSASSRSYVRYVAFAIYCTIFTFHLSEALFSPPARYPDLFAVLNVLISTPVFAITWLWSVKRGTQATWSVCTVISR